MKTSQHYRPRRDACPPVVRRLFTAMLAVTVCLSLMSPAAAASKAKSDELLAAQTLYELGLFRGTGQNPDGSPDFALDREVNRYESVVMLVRLAGESEEGNLPTPFTDLVSWAAPYVGISYANNWVTGTSATTFGGNQTTSATQYLTLVLRTLGYKSGDDFQWNRAWELSDEIGLTNGEYNEETVRFTRGDMAKISLRALFLESKWSKHTDYTLLDDLIKRGKVPADAKELPSVKRAKIDFIFPNSKFYILGEDDQEIAPYLQKAAERKERILNSPTGIVKADEFIPGETYSSTAYYVSPSGDDANDGLTPETAWRTLERTLKVSLNEGDAVFFQRGAVYRVPDGLPLFTGVTYSAYGEGSKPVFTVCEENSARPECWKLTYEGPGGEKIWRFYKQMYSAAGIVFDDSSYAKHIFEWPTPQGWMTIEYPALDPVHGEFNRDDPCARYELTGTGEYPTPEQALTEDMSFIFRPDTDVSAYPINFDGGVGAGDIWLRCDAGNPGELFGDVEVIALSQPRSTKGLSVNVLMALETSADRFVLDNISIKYFADNALSGWLSENFGAVIQNCTVEWGGSRYHNALSEEPTVEFFQIGDGIYCVGSDTVIRNCYMRQCSNGFTFENCPEMPASCGTYEACGNLLENCAQGIRTYLIEPYAEQFESLVLRDNIVLNTGDCMNSGCSEIPAAIDLGSDIQFSKYIEVTDNVMIGSTEVLMRIPPVNWVRADLSQNVFAQSRDGLLAVEMRFDEDGRFTWYEMSDIG